MTWVGKENLVVEHLTAHGVLIGTEIEKILSYATRIALASSVGKKVISRMREKDHRVSWGGSSKAIKSELAIDILVSPPQKSLAYQQLS